MISLPEARSNKSALDKDAVRAACQGRMVDVLESAGFDRSILDGEHHPCPQCGGTDRFRLIDANAGAVLCNQCGRDIGDVFRSIQWLTGCTFPEAVATAAEAAGVADPAREKVPSNLPAEVPAGDFSKLELKQFSGEMVPHFARNRPGVTEDALAAAGAKLGRDCGRAVFALPIVGETLDPAVPVGWVTMSVTGGMLNVGESEVKTKLAKGSKPGLVGSRSAFEQLRNGQAGLTVWKVEGVTDALALWAKIPGPLRDRQLVLTNSNGCGQYIPWLAERLRVVRQVNVLHDADQPGESGAEKWCKSLAADGVKAVQFRLPYEVSETHGKDLRDWLNDGHTFDELPSLMADGGVYEPLESNKPEPVKQFTFGELTKEYPDRRPYVINGLIREGQSMNIVSNSKSGKSWMVHGLALSIVCHERWLGHFDVAGGKVLLVDNELHPEDLRYRVRTVGDAMGIDPERYQNDLVLWPLRGDLRSLSGLQPSFAEIEHGTYKLIILDAKYRFGEPGESENDNSSETQFYNRIDAIGKQTGASIVMVHHASKGDQSAKSVTDVGAGAGAQSRAVDCHATLRQHQSDDAVVFQAAPRSFAPIKPVALRWSFPLWSPAPDLDPSDLKPPPNSRGGKESKSEAMARVRNLLAASPEGLTTTKLESLSKEDGSPQGMGRRRIEDALRTMIDTKEVTARPAFLGGKDTMSYRLTEGGPSQSAGGPSDCTTEGGPSVRQSSP